MIESSAACWICGAPATPDARYAALRLVRCGTCGFLFAPVRSAEGLRALYTKDYFDKYPGGRAYDADEPQRLHEAAVRLRWLQREVAGGRLLELGSASGWFLAQAREGGFDVEGIEPAAEIAAASRERWGVHVQAATAESAILPDGELDAIVAWHVLEHITQPRPVLERLCGALRPGGLLLLELPNVESAAARAQGPDWFHLDPAHHVGHYAPATLSDLLRRSGFVPIQVDTFPSAGYLRPDVARRPKALAWQLKQALTHRASPRRPHPTRHEMLRAVARRP